MRIRSLSRILGFLALLITSQSLHAQSRTAFDVPAQPLAASLREVATQASVNLLFDPPLVEGRQARALKGSFTTDEALTRLLDGTDLKVRHLDEKTLTVVRISTPQAPSTVAAASVAADPNQSLNNDRRTGNNNSQDFRVAQVAQANTGPQITSDATPKKDESLTEIVVTGTHIRGVDPSSPVITVTQEDIARSGYTSIGDVVRSLPQNFGGSNNPQGAVGSAPGGIENANQSGGTAPNLRGLGSGSTLTLVNGRRLAQDALSGATDITLIPLAAIDRVEVVTDGASAAYGSDAVAGVVNIILKKSYSGAETSASIGRATDGGGLERRASQLLGTAWSTGNVLLAYEFDEQDAVDSSQRSFTSAVLSPYSLLPETHRNSVLISGRQDVTEALSFFVEGLYSARSATFDETLVAAQPQEGSEHVRSYTATVGSDLTLPGQWQATAFGSLANQRNLAGQYYLPPQPTAGTLFANQDVVGKTDTFEANANGPLFATPAGLVRAALGAGYRREQFDYTYPSIDYSLIAPAKRDVKYLFAELDAPLVAPSDRPGLNRLEINVSGRYERYTDFGSESVPHLGLTYVPIPGVTVRASWSKSFRAPPFYDLYGPIAAAVDIFNDSKSPTGTSTVIDVNGSNAALRPETANSWTLGADIVPESFHGFEVSPTYFKIRYTNRITQLADYATALTNPANAPFVTRNPSAALQQAVIDSTHGNFYNDTANPYDPASIAAIVYLGYLNVSHQNIDGVDLLMRYRKSTSFGNWDAFLNGSYLELRQQITSDYPAEYLSGTSFYPPRFRGRGGTTWTFGGFAATAIVNYLAPVTNTFAAPESHVSSWTTVDAQVAYGFPAESGFTHGLRFTVSAQNLFDRDPPFITFDTLRTGFHYDPLNSTPMGRFVTVGVSKAW